MKRLLKQFMDDGLSLRSHSSRIMALKLST
jgi:hypothetical protein